MNDGDIARLLASAGVPAGARYIAVYRLLQAAERRMTVEDIYAAALQFDTGMNFVAVARIVRRLWIAGLLERELRPERAGRQKAAFGKLAAAYRRQDVGA